MLKPEDVKAVGTFAVDTTKGPKVIVFTWKSNPWLTEEYFTQRSIYALAGDSLKICSCFPGQGTKGLLPTEFTAKAGSKRGLSTFRRDRPSGQRGEKKAREGAGEEKGGDTKQSAEEVRRKLQGAWKLATIEVDGLTAGEGRPELKGNRLVIERGSLTFFCTPDLGVFGDRAAGANEAAATFTLNAKRAPLVIVLTWKECPWNGKEDFMQEAICAVAGDTLTLCLGGKDGEVKAPTDFSAEAGSRRLLWTFKRVAGPGRPGEKHAAPHD